MECIVEIRSEVLGLSKAYWVQETIVKENLGVGWMSVSRYLERYWELKGWIEKSLQLNENDEEPTSATPRGQTSQ